MARATLETVRILRLTARRLRLGAPYRWTHMGSCNCGHLAQTVTRRSPRELHELALQKAGDWAEQTVDHCPTSGYPMDHVLHVMTDAGFTLDDLARLERLSDGRVLRRIPADRRPLDHRRREDVVLYLESWADLLDERRRRTELESMGASLRRAS